MMKKIIFLLLALLCLTTLCIGEITNISYETTDSTIQWTWEAINNTSVTQMSVDGYVVWNYDPYATQFILSDLASNTSHEIKLYTINESYSSIVRTNATPPTQVDTTFAFINLWILFFVALICIIIGVWVPAIAIIGAIFAILGIVSSFNHSFAMGFIFCMAFIAGLIVGMTK
jgi:hypothetical protein